MSRSAGQLHPGQTIYLLVMWVLGILSPAVLLPGRLFSGPDHAPTLEGQYVLKDIILLTASLVIVAATLRRAKVDTHPPPPGLGEEPGRYGEKDVSTP